MKILCVSTCSALVLSLLAALGASARDVSSARRAVLKVTLQGTVTKSWNTVTHTTLSGCEVAIHSIGTRKVTLRSKRATKVLVTSRPGGVSYRPHAVRFVAIAVSGSGDQTTKYESPCQQPTEHVNCPRAHKVLSGATLGFFRSRRNEISFRPVRLPDVGGSCPFQSATVRGIRPGLNQAQGELAEAALTNPRAPGQTAIASADVTSELDGDEEGTVTERVRWSLAFAR
jgi:hypothetical protein